MFSPWLSCLTVRLALEQLAMESALANSVMFSEISVGDAVAAAPSDGQHSMRSRRKRDSHDALWALIDPCCSFVRDFL